MEYQKMLLPARGKSRNAIYTEQQISNYIGNPLIEALPRILTMPEAMKKLSHYPDYDESMRHLPTELRYLMLEDIVRFYTPLNIHVDLERRFSRLIRTGYIERNPLKTIFWERNSKQAGKVSEDSIRS